MGTNSSAHAASLEDEEKEIPVAKHVGRSEVEQVGHHCWHATLGLFEDPNNSKFHSNPK
jgi:hypothetical protein